MTPRSAARSKRGLIVISGAGHIAHHPGCAQARQSPHLLGDLGRGGAQLDRILAAEIDHHVTAAAGTSAVLTLEADAGIGKLGERGRQIALELRAGMLAVLLKDDLELARSRLNSFEYMLDVGVPSDNRGARRPRTRSAAGWSREACRYSPTKSRD